MKKGEGFVELELRIHPQVINDLQEAKDYFNGKQKNLGNLFEKAATVQILNLSKSAFQFAVKYENVRCVAVNGFPYLVHYEIDDRAKVVFVHAVICTYRNPNVYWKKRK